MWQDATAWENACRLAQDGRFGENKMRVYVGQNDPFSLMYDAWKAGSRELPHMDPEEGRHKSDMILGSVLSNRKPPYGITGGLYDVLKASGGEFRNREGYDLLPASCVAVAALAQAVKDGTVKKDEYIMLNCTGGGTLGAMARGYVYKEPDLILSPDTPAEDVVQAVLKLF